MKIKRSIFIFILLFISFFSFVDGIDAATVKGIYYNDGRSKFGNETFLRDGVTKYVREIGIFVKIADNKNEQVYCIEPNQPLSSSGYQNNKAPIKFNSYTGFNGDTAKKTNIHYILNYAYKDSAPTTFNVNKFAKIAAAQGLIWEVALGERKNCNRV